MILSTVIVTQPVYQTMTKNAKNTIQLLLRIEKPNVKAHANPTTPRLKKNINKVKPKGIDQHQCCETTCDLFQIHRNSIYHGCCTV